MFLKEIEIQGFKSFADKTKVVFDQGVTAVVGPNGSGKSNITESLRWALGESSVKSLRGGKMPDVIFAGTENRKPLNYASVVVLLDNKDQFIKNAGAEIRVERHIYRSGDSEYKIDGKKVRLRDIHDLFMDTGLGRDSFSIISQGKVEEIFNSKPEERRAIFEEAAGVLKYKTRRKETESKLNQTQDNLDRLEDIIYELDSQVKPLEKQAKTAKRFLELDKERKRLYLDILVAQIHKNKEELTELEKNLEIVQEELKSYYQKRDELEVKSQELKAQRQKCLHEQESSQNALLDLTRLISDLEGKIQVAKLAASQEAANREEILERIATLTAKKEQAEGEQAANQEEILNLSANLTSLDQKIANLEEELRDFSDDPDQMIERLRERYVKLMQEEAGLSNDLTALEVQLKSQEQENQSKLENRRKLENDLDVVRKQADEQRQELEQVRTNLEELLKNYQVLSNEHVKTENHYQEAQKSMFDSMDELKNKKARKTSLENILQNHSNLYAGVKAILQNAKQIGGILGAVSENLSFDAKYQTALEIALGASSQNIIVVDEEAAKRAIRYLKQNRLGRATLLPLTTIKPREIVSHHRQTIQSSQGFLGVASELVRFDQDFETIYKNLLGTTAVFDTTENAQRAARAVRYQVRIVTLDGTELRPGGSYAGGANRNQQTIFVKPELEVLTSQIEADEKALAERENKVAELQEQLTRLSQQMQELKEEGDLARLAEQKANLSYQQTQERLGELEDLLDASAEQESIGTGQELQVKKEALAQRLSEIEQAKMDLTEEIEQVKSNKEAVQARFDKLNETLSAARLERTEFASRKGFEESQKKRIEAEKAELIQQIAALESRLEQGDSIEEPVDIAHLEEQLTDAKERKESLNQAMIRLRFELEDVEGQSDDLQEQLAHSRSQNENWIRQQATFEAQKEKIVEQLQNLVLTLTEDYKMSFEEANQQADELADLPVAESQHKELQKAIRALGPVNLEAIEQYDEVKNRLDFLNTQRDDVLSAKNLLLATIEEMNDEVKERFKSTFEAIRESFKVTFRQMFGGGSADLILTEGDLLTAGVEISVQPPGKKIQSLNLMSGGEKALSALALLFSIIRVKTIPFVILDEVEAALDEANVKRFGDYLNRFDKESQFIVVTHRKGTMSAADSIYGVTMQESGVSKIVSVKLKDLESV